MSDREAPKSKVVGTKKYREWIHEDSKRLDKKNLPYTFSKPKKDKPLNTYYRCSECGTSMAVHEETILVECSGCGFLLRVKEFKKKGLFND